MGRHLELLERSTDGRIRDADRRHARALDDAERLAAPVARVAVRVIAFKPEFIIRQMAKVIAEAAPKRESVHVKDFERAGITKTLAERHFAAAFARARMLEPAIDRLEVA